MSPPTPAKGYYDDVMHQCRKRFAPSRPSVAESGASIRAAIVLIGILGVVFVILQYAARSAAIFAYEPSSLVAAASAPLQGAQYDPATGQSRYPCGQRELASAGADATKNGTEACLPGCTYKVTPGNPPKISALVPTALSAPYPSSAGGTCTVEVCGAGSSYDCPIVSDKNLGSSIGNDSTAITAMGIAKADTPGVAADIVSTYSANGGSGYLGQLGTSLAYVDASAYSPSSGAQTGTAGSDVNGTSLGTYGPYSASGVQANLEAAQAQLQALENPPEESVPDAPTTGVPVTVGEAGSNITQIAANAPPNSGGDTGIQPTGCQSANCVDGENGTYGSASTFSKASQDAPTPAASPSNGSPFGGVFSWVTGGSSDSGSLIALNDAASYGPIPASSYGSLVTMYGSLDTTPFPGSDDSSPLASALAAQPKADLSNGDEAGVAVMRDITAPPSSGPVDVSAPTPDNGIPSLAVDTGSNQGCITDPLMCAGQSAGVVNLGSASADLNLSPYSDSGSLITPTAETAASQSETPSAIPPEAAYSSTSNTDQSVGYNFQSYLTYGSTGASVVALQERLASDGLYTGPIDGTYGPLTTAAVQEYQSQYGLPRDGVVGPLTRAQLNGGK